MARLSILLLLPILVPILATNCTALPGVTITTPTIQWYPVSGVKPEQCCQLCANFAGCAAFTVNASGCALKSDTNGMKPEPSSTSGLNSGPGPGPKPKCTGKSAGLAEEDCVGWTKLYDATDGEHWKDTSGQGYGPGCSEYRLDPCACGIVTCDGGHITRM